MKRTAKNADQQLTKLVPTLEVIVQGFEQAAESQWELGAQAKKAREDLGQIAELILAGVQLEPDQEYARIKALAEATHDLMGRMHQGPLGSPEYAPTVQAMASPLATYQQARHVLALQVGDVCEFCESEDCPVR